MSYPNLGNWSKRLKCELCPVPPPGAEPVPDLTYPPDAYQPDPTYAPPPAPPPDLYRKYLKDRDDHKDDPGVGVGFRPARLYVKGRF